LMVQSTYIHFIMNLNLSQEQGANIKWRKKPIYQLREAWGIELMS
jgi:hypothetical protein